MKILAIDTATEACSVALADNDVIHEVFAIAPQQHAQKILADIDLLLAEHETTLNQIDVIAFGRGPGSFTGVRIAASVCQGLALAHDKPVAAISNLEALAMRAHRLGGHSCVLPAIDARMQEIYWALYEYDQKTKSMKEMGKEQVSAIDSIASISKTPCAIGSAWDQYQDEMQSFLKVEPFYANEFPHAYDIASIALNHAAENKLISAEQAIPIYLRDNVAKRQKEK